MCACPVPVPPCVPPQILILAGTDRLDKELMVGQMQGRFQLVLLPQARCAALCCAAL